MRQNMGASVPDQALAVPATPLRVDGPTGFDPSRVRVSAADFNGHDWDGSPFNHIPPWLEAALRLGAVTIKADDRDYALWAVNTPTGVKVAEPGDDIVCVDGHFDVHKDSYLASGMSAFGQDPQGLEAKPASPTAAGGDARTPSGHPNTSTQGVNRHG